LPLRVVELDERYEKAFWDLVWKDKIEYYFHIVDWRDERDRTKIFLALEGDRIEGLLVQYKEFIANVKGSDRAVDALLDLDLGGMSINITRDHKDLLLSKYASDEVLEIALLHMKREQFRPFKGTAPVKLGSKDAEDIVDLLRAIGPDVWDERAIANIMDDMDRRIWFGIRADGLLATAGMASLTDFAGIVHTMATREAYRGRGYAKSVVSTLTGELLAGTEDAMIFVRDQNVPAVKAYTGIGYRPFNLYVNMRAAVRRDGKS